MKKHPAPAKQSQASALQIVLSPEDRAVLERAANRCNTTPEELLASHAMRGVAKVDAVVADVPKTPLLDNLLGHSICSHKSRDEQPGLRLPTPGLLGELTISESQALLRLAELVINFDQDLMRLAVARFPSDRKDIADSILLAETVFVRAYGVRSIEPERREEETVAQLFCRWASGGRDFAEFEKIVAERDAMLAVKNARDAAVGREPSGKLAA